jgi:hypothetical protein
MAKKAVESVDLRETRPPALIRRNKDGVILSSRV